MEESSTDTDHVWIHDYHLLVLPSLLRKRFNRIRCGLFLHSPFPSSEIFRTFPKREELLRSLLNADLIGGHGTMLRCCIGASSLLGLNGSGGVGDVSVSLITRYHVYADRARRCATVGLLSSGWTGGQPGTCWDVASQLGVRRGSRSGGHVWAFPA